MPANMSFALTTAQFIARTKFVTRRMGWEKLKAGDVLWGVEKCMGMKRGEKRKRLSRIHIIDVRRERLSRMIDDAEYGKAEAIAEGFPELSGAEFVAMFCDAMKPKNGPREIVTRIQFEYLEGEG